MGRTMTWEGRRLISTTKNGALIQYSYDDGGLRLSKQDSTGTTRYTYDNGKIVHQYTENNGVISNELFFRYDENGAPLSVSYNGTEYFYVLNLQGDIIAIIDNSGAVVVEYSYDSWGKLIATTGSMATTLGVVNPLRYRGYYYDTDTGFYYCQSRYYDPEVGRFISADGELSGVGGDILGYNLFSYCFNNPVNMSDPSGNWPSWATKLIAAVAVVAAVAIVAAVTVLTAGAGSAAAVIAVGALKGAATGLATGAIIGAGTAAVNHRVSTGSWEGAGEAALNGMADGALSGAVTGAITGAANGVIKVAQAAKAWDCGTFKSGYQSMNYHYKEHVIKEGLTKGNNVLKYTQDALDFANRNSSALKYTFNYKYGNASWNFTYFAGQGGMFTSTGNILTFWCR